ncbi:MAG TPA: hypothetical protein VK774_01680, partial [Solirubrobacteraceae bacterium]|nr:hypothetical protein [Solirubrobacteraceae bacterium]
MLRKGTERRIERTYEGTLVYADRQQQRKRRGPDGVFELTCFLACVAMAFASSLALPRPARAEWTPPVQLSATGGNVRVAEDGHGDAFATWQECRSGCKGQVVIADYLPAGASTWQPPVQISTAEESYLAGIAGDSFGDGLAAWVTPAGLQSAVRPAALGSWQAPTPIGPTSGEANDLRLAADPAGGAVAVWGNQGFAIEAAVRPAATGQWEAPVVVSGPDERASEPQVAIREGGEVAVVWKVYEPETIPCPSPPSSDPCSLILSSKESMKAAFRSDAGTWQAPFALASADSVDEPQISLDDAGNATALWRASSGEKRAVESSQRPAGGAWQPPVTLTVTPLPHIGNPLDSSLQLAVNGLGEATAAWVHESPNALGGLSGVGVVETAIRNADGSWQTPTVISGSEHAGSLRLAENSSGTAAAVWSCDVAGHYPLTTLGSVRPGADTS